jgi:acetyl esterase/lipase
VIAGDSAGGGLALATLVALRNQQIPLPCAAVLLSPWVDLTLSAPSLDGDADRDPQVSRELLEECARHYLAEASPRSPLASPLFADLSGLPPVLVHVGAAEILRDDGTRLADALRRAGTAVTLECWDDMIHVWHQFAPGLPEASAALERVGAWLDPWWGEAVPAELGVDPGAGGRP